MVYMPDPELTYEFMTLVVNTSGDPSLVARPIQNLLHEMDPDQPVSDVRSMNEVMSGAVSRERFNTLLLGLFAFPATVLAAVGIFGVMNYTVALRTPEIGLRMALGAQRKTVMLLVLKKVVALMLGG